jgi:hypothetical protein
MRTCSSCVMLTRRVASNLRRTRFKPSSANPLDDVEGMGGIDTSVGAVAQRVGVVLVVSIVLFTALFFGGLQFLKDT